MNMNYGKIGVMPKSCNPETNMACAEEKPYSATEQSFNRLETSMKELIGTFDVLRDKISPVLVPFPEPKDCEEKLTGATVARSPLVERLDRHNNEIRYLLNRVSDAVKTIQL